MDFPVQPMTWNRFAAVNTSRTSQGSLVTSYRRSSNYVLLHILSEYELYDPDCVGRPGDPETIRGHLRRARWTQLPMEHLMDWHKVRPTPPTGCCA